MGREDLVLHEWEPLLDTNSGCTCKNFLWDLRKGMKVRSGKKLSLLMENAYKSQHGHQSSDS